MMYFYCAAGMFCDSGRDDLVILVKRFSNEETILGRVDGDSLELPFILDLRPKSVLRRES